METPEHERRAIEEYLRSHGDSGFQIEHVEKLTSEYVLGGQYDVWDAHTNQGRWWVITNPTNLYSQQHIKSMDVALSFHIGLMMRVRALHNTSSAQNRHRWVPDILRRLDLAASELERAVEVDDYQAIGMRLREALLSLASALSELDGLHSPTDDLPKAGDFKAWAHLAAGNLGAGSESEHLRTYLRTTSEKTWGHVNWLTHARHASEVDARFALSATSQIIEAFILGVERWRLGRPRRCSVCGSYRLRIDFDNGQWNTACSVCGDTMLTEPPPSADVATDEMLRPAQPEGDCITTEGFDIFLSPAQAQSMLESAEQALVARSGPQWHSRFATLGSEDQVVDAHRLVFSVTGRELEPGSELVYTCGDDNCVNPSHATAEPLPSGEYVIAIVEAAIPHSDQVELVVSSPLVGRRRILVHVGILDRHGLSDISDLLERVVCITAADTDGQRSLVLVDKRVHYGETSISNASVVPEQPAVDLQPDAT